MGLDITQTSPNQGDGSNATRIQGDEVSGTQPTDGQTLVFRTATQQYVPETPSGGSVALGSITGLGTGVGTALAIAAGAAGGFALNDSLVTPATPIAYWNFDEGAGPVGHNRVAYQRASSNMFAHPCDLALVDAWTWTPSTTRTARYALAPDGTDRATRVVITAGGANGAGLGQNVTVTAGSHTLSVWVASNTGAAQTISQYDGNGYTGNYTVPATGWKRISTAVTLTAGSKLLLPIARASDGSAVDVIAWGAQLELGSGSNVSDPGNVALQGTTAWTSTGLNFNGASRYALAALPATKLGNFSLYAVVNWPSANSPVSGVWAGVAGAISEPLWVAANANSAGPAVGMAGSYGASNFMGPNQIKDSAWHVLTGTYDGTTQRLYIDGDLANSRAASIAPAILNSFLVGNIQFGNFPFPGVVAHVSIYGQHHTISQVRAESARLICSLATRGITQTRREVYLMFEGDSITAGAGATAYANFWPVRVNNSLGYFGMNVGTSSALVATAVARASVVDAQILSGRRNQILVVSIGTNNIGLGNQTAAVAKAELAAYCNARRAAGWKVLVGTVLSRSGTFGGTGGGTMDAQVQAYNALIRADTSFRDGLIDFASEPLLGATGASANATYFADTVHPTDAGYALMAPIASAAISAYIAANP